MKTAEGSELTLDVYDMRVPANAAAMFEKERSPGAKPVEGWPEALSGNMSLVFHAGRYYVKLTAFDAKAEAALADIGKALLARASGEAQAKPAAKPDDDAAMRALFDRDLAGAKPKAKVELYDHDGLYDYIDGAAPVYLARGFRKLATAELATADGAELTLDVYDMRVAANTESIFEKELSPAAKPVEGWPEAVTGSMSFVFRRGRYYVKLTAFDAKAEALLPKVAAALKEAMP